jgi:hypothetical protein
MSLCASWPEVLVTRDNLYICSHYAHHQLVLNAMSLNADTLVFDSSFLKDSSSKKIHTE